MASGLTGARQGWHGSGLAGYVGGETGGVTGGDDGGDTGGETGGETVVVGATRVILKSSGFVLRFSGSSVIQNKLTLVNRK